MSYSTEAANQQATPADLSSLLALLGEHGIEPLVHGGWALDALTGTSRIHSDIDLLMDEKHRDKVRSLFPGDIVAETSHKLEVRFSNTSADIVFFRRHGRAFATVSPRIIILWPPDLVSASQVVEMNGTSLRIVPLPVLYRQLANTVRKKAPMLAKNQRDLRVIAPFLEESDRQIGRYYPRPNTFWNRLRLRLRLM